MSLKYLFVNIYWFCKFTKNIYNIVYLAALKNIMHKGIYRLFSYYLYFLCLLT